MAQIFHPGTNTLSRVSLFGAVLFLAGLAWVGGELYRSPYVTGVGSPLEQPVPFSHKHHVRDDGIDCRYCHTSVETSPFAGLPATKVCLSCHTQIWPEAPMLEPVRKSFRENRPLQWTRVHHVPQFVYFDHRIHIHKGIGCTTCHGPVGDMPLTWQSATLHMRWCLDCHEAPEKFIRPRTEIYNIDWQPPVDQLARGRELVQDYHVQSLIDCYTCHR